MKGYYIKHFRKILTSILLVIIIMVNGLFSKSVLAYTPEIVEKCDLTVDESKFDVEWQEKRIVKVYQTEQIKDSDFNVGDYLGYAEVEFGFATEIDDGDEYIDQMILFRVVMHPRHMTDSKQSVPYMLAVDVSRNDDMDFEMVCAGSSINEIYHKEEAVIYVTNIYDHGNFRWDFMYDKYSKKELSGCQYDKNELYGIAKWSIDKDVEYRDWTFDVKVVAEFTEGNKENKYIIEDDGYPKVVGVGIGRFSFNAE